MADSEARRVSANGIGTAQRLWTIVRTVVCHGEEWAADRRYAREHRRLLEQLAAAGELEALLEATGATREELLRAELTPLAALGLLHRMMQRLGIEARHAANHVDVIAEARRQCRSCHEWRQCRRWLDRGTLDEAYRQFCANAEVLERLRVTSAEQAATRRAPAELAPCPGELQTASVAVPLAGLRH
jgi:hypothetical protein